VGTLDGNRSTGPLLSTRNDPRRFDFTRRSKSVTFGLKSRSVELDYTAKFMIAESTCVPAWQIAAAIRDRQLSVVDVVEAHLSRIQRLNPELNAFVSVDAERARREAEVAAQALASRKPTGPLHGVPITIKSSIDVAGLPCETGTRLRQGHVPVADAPLVTRLKSAGAIVLGNTAVPEFLMAWETDNALYGRTNSPWDQGRTPGGSSGGEAAAIAACCSAGGIGSDGGGSIRVPAHFSGICGLKPTPGRIPATGHFPASVGPFSLIGVVGPMARTVRDLELLFEVIAGPDHGDPNAAPVPIRKVDEAVLLQSRIGYFEDDGRVPVTTETRAAVQRAAQVLRDDGFVVEPFLPEGLADAVRLWRVLFIDGVSLLLRQSYKEREADMYSIVREIIQYSEQDPPLTTERLLDTLFGRDLVRTRFLEQMDRYPILLCPVSASPAFRHGERSWNIGGKTVEYLDSFAYSQYFNLLGNPAAVIPMGFSPEGLPIGVQIVGRPWDEERVLAVAARIEKAGGWKEPPKVEKEGS
jgi:Asp-tRNA(Asn)/Glu-tRNA(Gln) amidotransferase A subunit family amidase